MIQTIFLNAEYVVFRLRIYDQQLTKKNELLCNLQIKLWFCKSVIMQ